MWWLFWPSSHNFDYDFHLLYAYKIGIKTYEIQTFCKTNTIISFIHVTRKIVQKKCMLPWSGAWWSFSSWLYQIWHCRYTAYLRFVLTLAPLLHAPTAISTTQDPSTGPHYVFQHSASLVLSHILLPALLNHDRVWSIPRWWSWPPHSHLSLNHPITSECLID